MPAEITFFKRGGMAIPYMEDDIAAFRKMPQGQAFTTEAVRVTDRSLKQMGLYWGGLLELALTYWEPDIGCLTPGEIGCVDRVIAYIEKIGERPGSLQEAKKFALEEISRVRRHKYEIPSKTKRHLHDWILEQLDMYDLYQTPEGIRKKLKSISFRNMNQSDFYYFYTCAFGVVWTLVMSKIYETEGDFQEAVIFQLTEMGR